jgi:hypothetical protein
MTKARINPTPDLHAFINESEALAENTKAGYRRAVDRWIGFVGPKLVDWTPANAMAFYKSLRADPKLSLKSANTIMWGVRYVMKRLTQMLGNAFPVNPIDTVERARVRAGRDDVTIVRALTPKRVGRSTKRAAATTSSRSATARSCCSASSPACGALRSSRPRRSPRG